MRFEALPAFHQDVVGISGDGQADDEVAAQQRVDGQLHQDLVRQESVPSQDVLEELERAPELPAQKLGVTARRVFQQPVVEN